MFHSKDQTVVKCQHESSRSLIRCHHLPSCAVDARSLEIDSQGKPEATLDTVQGSWQTLASGIIIMMLPAVLTYVFFQKCILAGVVAGAVKE